MGDIFIQLDKVSEYNQKIYRNRLKKIVKIVKEIFPEYIEKVREYFSKRECTFYHQKCFEILSKYHDLVKSKNQELEEKIISEIRYSNLSDYSKVVLFETTRIVLSKIFDFPLSKLKEIKLKKECEYKRKTPEDYYSFILINYLKEYTEWIKEQHYCFVLNKLCIPKWFEDRFKCLKYLNPVYDYDILKYFFLFILNTGCRISEAINLKWNRVYKNEEGQIESIELFGKGKKTRKIIPNSVVQLILKKIKERQSFLNKFNRDFYNKLVFGLLFSKIPRVDEDTTIKDIEKFYVSTTYRKKSYKEINTYVLYAFWKGFFDWLNMEKLNEVRNKILEKYGIKIRKIEYIVPHQLRHLFATSIYKISKDIIFIKEMLGHSDLKYSLIYVKGLANIQNRKYVDAFFKLSKEGVLK